MSNKWIEGKMRRPLNAFGRKQERNGKGAK